MSDAKKLVVELKKKLVEAFKRSSELAKKADKGTLAEQANEQARIQKLDDAAKDEMLALDGQLDVARKAYVKELRARVVERDKHLPDGGMAHMRILLGDAEAMFEATIDNEDDALIESFERDLDPK